MRYTIMQLKNNDEELLIKYGFRSFEDVIKYDFDIDFLYEDVYTGELIFDEGETVEHFLDDLFTIFNIHRPADFKGHSMSVGDIVVLEDGSQYYCDSFGWKVIR